MQEKKAITREISKRYQKAGKKEKTRILDEIIKTTGYNRKYILHVLTNFGRTTIHQRPSDKRKIGGGRKQIYTDEFKTVLRAIWVFFWYRCGKILSPFIREQIKYLVPAFHITAEVKRLLLKVSPATIDRILKEDRKKLIIKGKSLTKPGTLLKKQIPVRTYYAEADKKPGFFEADTVHHCGTSEMGEFCLTLTATDVYSGWVELRPTLNKASKWVFEALLDIKSSLPFPLLGLDSDNGHEFINSAVLKWCQSERIQFTRTRSYRKNDNCFVEQKNFSCVRNFVGYYRFSGKEQTQALASVYRYLCPLLNFFIPTFRLASKTRVGSKIKKVYDKNAQSPYQRLMSSSDLSDKTKAGLMRVYKLYNPVKLQQDVHKALDVLMSLNRAINLEAGKTLNVSTLHSSVYG
jgi:hypothetical protein